MGGGYEGYLLGQSKKPLGRLGQDVLIFTSRQALWIVPTTSCLFSWSRTLSTCHRQRYFMINGLEFMLVVPTLAERFGGGSWSCGPSMSKQTRLDHKAGNGIQWYTMVYYKSHCCTILIQESYTQIQQRNHNFDLRDEMLWSLVPLCFRGVCQASNELPCEASNIDKGGAPGPAVTLFPFSVVCCHGCMIPVLTASYVVTLDYSCITT